MNMGYLIQCASPQEIQLYCLGVLTTMDRLGLDLTITNDDMTEGAEEIFKQELERMTEKERVEFGLRVALALQEAMRVECQGIDLEAWGLAVKKKQADARLN